MILDEAERQALVGDLDIDGPLAPPRGHLAGFIDPAEPAPWYARPLDWCESMIGSLSPASRLVVNITAIASFLAACAALIYVLTLRQS